MAEGARRPQFSDEHARGGITAAGKMRCRFPPLLARTDSTSGQLREKVTNTVERRSAKRPRPKSKRKGLFWVYFLTFLFFFSFLFLVTENPRQTLRFCFFCALFRRNRTCRKTMTDWYRKCFPTSGSFGKFGARPRVMTIRWLG